MMKNDENWIQCGCGGLFHWNDCVEVSTHHNDGVIDLEVWSMRNLAAEDRLHQCCKRGVLKPGTPEIEERAYLRQQLERITEELNHA